VVWAGLLEKPLKVVRRWPHRTLAAACIGRDASHTRASRLTVVAVIADGHGRGPLRALFVPLDAAFDTLLGVVSGDVRRCLLITV
jgi:hypothetical protein